MPPNNPPSVSCHPIEEPRPDSVRPSCPGKSLAREIALFRQDTVALPALSKPAAYSSRSAHSIANPDQLRFSDKRYATHSGIRVRSKVEKIIADFLHDSRIPFQYEPHLHVAGHFLRPDFYLTKDHILYEHFGLSTPQYLKRAEQKIALYHQAAIPFIYTTFKDEPDIEEVIVDQLASVALDRSNGGGSPLAGTPPPLGVS